MDLERLIALIVKTVVEELLRQDVIRLDHTGVTLSQGQGKTVSSTVSNRSPGRVVSAQMILDAAKTGVTTYESPAHALITPLAREVAREKGIKIISADTG